MLITQKKSEAVRAADFFVSQVEFQNLFLEFTHFAILIHSLCYKLVC